jgi:hypothetical protein
MAMQKIRREDLLKDLDLLLGDLCKEWGFCNRLSAADLIADGTVLSDTEFAYAVLRAEKMKPEYEPNWVRRIRERFMTRYGSSISLTD